MLLEFKKIAVKTLSDYKLRNRDFSDHTQRRIQSVEKKIVVIKQMKTTFNNQENATNSEIEKESHLPYYNSQMLVLKNNENHEAYKEIIINYFLKIIENYYLKRNKLSRKKSSLREISITLTKQNFEGVILNMLKKQKKNMDRKLKEIKQ